MQGEVERVNAGAIDAPAMMTIPEFCRSHRISKSFLYKLAAQGKAPPICKLGARSLISADAASDWRRGLERQAA